MTDKNSRMMAGRIMKPEIKIAFTDWGAESRIFCDIVREILQESYTVVEDDSDPDFLFCNTFSWYHFHYDGAVKIAYYEENVYPDFNEFDYAISSVNGIENGRNLWLPLSFLFADHISLPQEVPAGAAQRPFCSFIYSQDDSGAYAPVRRDFCKALMEQYAHVDCPGRILHNTEAPELSSREDAGSWHDSKVAYLNKFKFNIAFENSNVPGYMTEKLIDPFAADTVPIYCGSCGNVAPFPKDAMICANDYPDTESLIARIREVNENDELYLEMLAKNPFRNGFKGEFKRRLAEFLLPIIAKGRCPVDKDAAKQSDARRLRRLFACGDGMLKIFYCLLRLKCRALRVRNWLINMVDPAGRESRRAHLNELYMAAFHIRQAYQPNIIEKRRARP